MGSETEYLNNTQPAYDDRHLFNKKLNSLIRDYQKQVDNLQLIDLNAYIKSQDYFTNNINHFSKEIYYNISNDLIKILNDNQLNVNKRKFLTNVKLFVLKVFKKIKRTLKKLKRK